MNKRYLKILLVIFSLSLIFNLYLSFSSPYLNNDRSYFNLRAIDNIRENGLPIFYDELSYGGRYLIIQPLFHYIFAALSFIPMFFKIFPALLISSLTIICYFIAKEITNDETSSLLTALMAGFIPIYSRVLINQLTVYVLIFPLTAFMILCFIKMDDRRYLKYFLIGSFMISLIHSSSFLFLFIFLFYILLMNAENMKITRLKREILLFSFLLIFLINILVFSGAFSKYGINIIHGNNPLSYEFNIFQSIYLLGIISLFLGIVGIYQGFFKLKNEGIILTSSIVLGTLFLLLMNMIDVNTGLLFLGFGLVISSSFAIKNFFIYIEKTKASRLKNLFILSFMILLLGLSVLPTYTNYKMDFTNLESFNWLRENTPEDSVVLAPMDYGQIVTYFALRRNVIDSNFILAPDPFQRYYDVNLIYEGWSYSKALELLHEYSVDYIYITKNAKNFYNLVDFKDVQNEECFREVKEDIYQLIC